MDTTITEDGFWKRAEHVDIELPCPTCYKELMGQTPYNVEDMPMRRVTAMFVTNETPETVVAYNLDCLHSVIDD